MSCFLHCAACFDFVNRIALRASQGRQADPANFKSRHDRQDRTTAFPAFVDLSLDPDDGAFHHPPRHGDGAVFRHAAAGLVADRDGLRPRRLFECAGFHRQPVRQADPVRLHMGAAASSGVRLPLFRLGPRLRLQGERARSADLGRADREASRRPCWSGSSPMRSEAPDERLSLDAHAARPRPQSRLLAFRHQGFLAPAPHRGGDDATDRACGRHHADADRPQPGGRRADPRLACRSRSSCCSSSSPAPGT